MKYLLKLSTAFVLLSSILFSNETLAGGFDGVYKTTCLNTEDDYLVSQIEIIKDNFKQSFLAFEDEKCKTLYLTYIEKFKFKLSGINWDGKTIEVGYVPHTAEVVRALNQISWCGISNWSLGEFQDVSGRQCGDLQTLKSGDMLYSLMREEVSKPGLRMGAASAEYNGLSIDKRHKDWSPFWHFQ